MFYTQRDGNWEIGEGERQILQIERGRVGGITSRDGIGSDLDRIFQNPYPILNKNNISISISIYYG